MRQPDFNEWEDGGDGSVLYDSESSRSVSKSTSGTPEKETLIESPKTPVSALRPVAPPKVSSKKKSAKQDILCLISRRLSTILSPRRLILGGSGRKARPESPASTDEESINDDESLGRHEMKSSTTFATFLSGGSTPLASGVAVPTTKARNLNRLGQFFGRRKIAIN